MIIADFGVICIEQTKCTYPKGIENIRFETYHRVPGSKPMYMEYYNFHTADMLTGYWYFVWPKDELLYKKPFFDLGEKGCPWVVVIQEWTEIVRKVLEFYIEQSPQNRIAVLIREQDQSDDIVHSAMKIDAYMENLIAGNIRWNELYFVEK